ncbi:MAG: proton-conducting transporter membrane subunit [Bdellovibrionota bacterium]
MSVSMTIFLLSMIGLPPFSGFIAKFYVFKSLLSQKYYMTALLGGINTAIAVYYYMKIIKWMFLKDSNDPEIPRYGKLARVCDFASCFSYFIRNLLKPSRLGKHRSLLSSKTFFGV